MVNGRFFCIIWSIVWELVKFLDSRTNTEFFVTCLVIGIVVSVIAEWITTPKSVQMSYCDECKMPQDDSENERIRLEQRRERKRQRKRTYNKKKKEAADTEKSSG